MKGATWTAAMGSEDKKSSNVVGIAATDTALCVVPI